MDGAIIAVSLLVLSWVTVMAPIVETSGGFSFSLVLSLAYPLGDVVLGTLVLIILFRSQSERMTLALLALGLGGFALADSVFLYLTSRGTYSSAGPGEQRWLGVRFPLRGRVRDERGPRDPRVRRERRTIEGPRHVAVAGAALPPPAWRPARLCSWTC